jgi:hypothetical protein
MADASRVMRVGSARSESEVLNLGGSARRIGRRQIAPAALQNNNARRLLQSAAEPTIRIVIDRWRECKWSNGGGQSHLRAALRSAQFKAQYFFGKQGRR